MPEFTHGIFETDQGSTAYSITGKGAPLLLLHGFPEFRGIWKAVAGFLSGRFSLVMPDLPGFGESPAPKSPEGMRADRLGVQVSGLMVALGHQRYGIVAHDAGAVVGWWLAAMRHEAVIGLALAASASPSDYLAAIPSLDASGRRAHVDRLLAGDLAYVNPDALTRWLEDPEQKLELARALKGGSVSAMQALYRQNLMPETAAFWAGINVPEQTRLCQILGRDDPFVPPDILTAQRGVRICLEGCGHFLPSLRPELLARHIAEFFGAGDAMEQVP